MGLCPFYPLVLLPDTIFIVATRVSSVFNDVCLSGRKRQLDVGDGEILGPLIMSDIYGEFDLYVHEIHRHQTRKSLPGNALFYFHPSLQACQLLSTLG